MADRETAEVREARRRLDEAQRMVEQEYGPLEGLPTIKLSDGSVWSYNVEHQHLPWYRHHQRAGYQHNWSAQPYAIVLDIPQGRTGHSVLTASDHRAIADVLDPPSRDALLDGTPPAVGQGFPEGSYAIPLERRLEAATTEFSHPRLGIKATNMHSTPLTTEEARRLLTLLRATPETQEKP